jgi:predicted ArsR family transcriptional regulator
MTQKERLLAYLKRNGSVNPLQAWSILGIYRLAARISDLKKDGVAIRSETGRALNQFGERISFAEYKLGDAI